MFSGIVETISRITQSRPEPGVMRISVEKPLEFNDLKTGDSIALDGVCLTLESFDSQSLQFALGDETLKVTGWTPESVRGKTVNLERSLRLGDRIHGHLVTGHVDGLGTVTGSESLGGETLRLRVRFPVALKPYIWPKGSIAINGVSLTLNRVEGEEFEVGLIPETVKRTGLGRLTPGDAVNLEVDNMARGLIWWEKGR